MAEMMKKLFTFFVVLCAIFLAAPFSYAAVSVEQPFVFGDYIVKNNNAVYDVTVNTDGSHSYDGAGFIEIIDTAAPGIYNIDSLPVSTAIISVTVSQISPLTGASGPNFPFSAFQETHPPTTDGLGVARITIGATVSTSGSGIAYIDDTYSGTIQITINF